MLPQSDLCSAAVVLLSVRPRITLTTSIGEDLRASEEDLAPREFGVNHGKNEKNGL